VDEVGDGGHTGSRGYRATVLESRRSLRLALGFAA
jgi:hypothetical protein